MNGSEIQIRHCSPADAATVVRIHFAAVQGTAAAAYSTEVVWAWSPPPDERRFDRIREAINSGQELFVLAEVGDVACGFGVVVPVEGELRAVYVDPALGRRGVGGAILDALEKLAVSRGVKELQLDAAINAEAFYVKHGYSIVGRGTHALSGGVEMACAHMRKTLPQMRTAD